MGVRAGPTVSLAIMRGLLCAVARTAVAPSAVLDAAAIGPEELELADARIDRPRFENACAVAIELTGDEALGLHWAEQSLRHGFGPISAGLAHAETLRKAFHLLVRFERFFTNAASHEVLEGPEHTSVRLPARSAPRIEVRRLWAELNVAWFIKVIRSMHAHAELTRIDFAYAAPSYAGDYERVFGHTVRFDRPFTEIVFPSRLLDTAAPVLAPPMLGEPLPGPRGRAALLSQRLHQLLLQRAPSRLDMANAARALGHSERSLRRHLAAEGHTYKEIEFKALSAVARHLLVDGERTIQETADALGFASLSAFHRAFKRWTGLTPKSVQSEARALRARSAASFSALQDDTS